MMANNAYWKKRFAQLEAAENKKGIAFYEELAELYDKTIRDVEKDLTYWYKRFAKNNGVSLSEAKRLLNSNELKAFKMTLEEYIEKGASVNPDWFKMLEQASSKVHISRLQSIKLQLQEQIELLFYEQASLFDDYALDTYKERFYRTAYEVQKGLGVGTRLDKINDDLIKKVISKPWTQDGKEFSSRIWDNRTKLVNEIHTTLTSALARGEAPDKTISAISKRLDVSRSNTAKLVLTESAFFTSAATKDSFKTLGVEQYEILATLDSRTSEICREMDGKIFKMSDFEVGTTAPPFHVYCRTTTVPYFDDDLEGERVSRDADDKGYILVPENITYKEWQRDFLK